MPVISSNAPAIPIAGVITGGSGNALTVATVAGNVVRNTFVVFCKDLLLPGDATELSVDVGSEATVEDKASCVTEETRTSVLEGGALLKEGECVDELGVTEVLKVEAGADALGELLPLVGGEIAAEADEAPFSCRICKS